MISEQQQEQQNQNRRRRRRNPSTTASSSSFNMASSGGVCGTTLLALVLIILPMELTLASPSRRGFPLRLGSFMSTRPSTLLQQRRDLSSDSLPFAFRSTAVHKPTTTTSVPTLYYDPLEEELSELDALYGDDQQESNVVAESESACFRPKSGQDATKLQKVSFSYFIKKHKHDATTLIPETSELQLLESSLSSKPKGSGVQQIIIPSATRTVVLATAAVLTPTSLGDKMIITETARGGSRKVAASNKLSSTRPLLFWESMVCGAISRSMAQTLLHPANAMKTILQNSRAETVASLMKPSAFPRLIQGAGANFLLSVPHGAVNFAVLEFVRSRLGALVAANPALQERSGRLGPTLDFASSAISTIVCSVVSTPQMMITDNIMAGNYNNLPQAVTGLANRGGVVAFYRGWWPGLVGKIPSYALTWTMFQELKVIRDRLTHHRPATNIENAIMGCLASATTVTIMIPLDTIKTRLVTQGGSAVGSRVYKGIIDCAVRVAREEGIATFYRGLPPRLASVVPMIGIQFGVYEAMKKFMLQRTGDAMPEKKVGGDKEKKPPRAIEYEASQVFEEAAMEVAASPEQPYPAPQFLKRVYQKTLEQTQKTLLEQSPQPWKKVLKLQR